MKFTKETEAARIVTVLDDYAGYETPFLAQHGISLLVEIQNGSNCHRILMDTGQSALPILHNLGILGIEPSS
ncbi:hypothetical protein Q6294_32095, partial [Klebsiella pneumoniae]|nr:hypothetical protein [Klebsiella pneumoniae]